MILTNDMYYHLSTSPLRITTTHTKVENISLLFTIICFTHNHNNTPPTIYRTLFYYHWYSENDPLWQTIFINLSEDITTTGHVSSVSRWPSWLHMAISNWNLKIKWYMNMWLEEVCWYSIANISQRTREAITTPSLRHSDVATLLLRHVSVDYNSLSSWTSTT